MSIRNRIKQFVRSPISDPLNRISQLASFLYSQIWMSRGGVLLGRQEGAGGAQEIVVGAGLTLVDGTLSAEGGSGGVSSWNDLEDIPATISYREGAGGDLRAGTNGISNSTTMAADVDQLIHFQTPQGGHIKFKAIFADVANVRYYTFPDRSGTVAFLDDLALKAPIASPTFTGSVTGSFIGPLEGNASTSDFAATAELAYTANTADFANLADIANRASVLEDGIISGPLRINATFIDYGPGSALTHLAALGLGNVTNTSDANKPVSTAQADFINDATFASKQLAVSEASDQAQGHVATAMSEVAVLLAAKAPLANPAFIGDLTITKTGDPTLTVEATTAGSPRLKLTANTTGSKTSYITAGLLGGDLQFQTQDGYLDNVTRMTIAANGTTTLSTPLPIGSGGTGGYTESAARTNLGLGTLATQSGTFSSAGINDTLNAGGLALSKLAQTGATSGQALSWNGTTWAAATVASNAASISAALGFEPAPRWLFTGPLATLSTALDVSAPKFVVIAGDSLSTNLTVPSAWAIAGQFGVGRYLTAGTAATSVVSNDWITGQYINHPIGSTSQFHPEGGVDAAYQAGKFAVGYLADSGVGGFDIEASSVQVNSGAWTKLGSTQNTENATLISKYVVFDVPTTSNAPQYKFRIINITDKPVKLLVWGFYSVGQGGVVTVKGMANLTGRDVSQWPLCPDAVFNPIWTGIAPDLVFSRWADAGTDWDVNGAFDIQYKRIKALKPSCDFIQMPMGRVYNLPVSPVTWPTYYPAQSTYRVGDMVKSQVDATGLYGWYNCTVAHTQSADKKPGQGSNWTSYWANHVYDSAILASSAAAVTEQIKKQSDWASRNLETFIDTSHAFGPDYPSSFAKGLTGDFVHPTTAGWASINAYVNNTLPLARAPQFSQFSAQGLMQWQISGAGNQVRLNRALRLSAAASSGLTIDASDAGTDNSKKLDIAQTADVGIISVNGIPIIRMYRSPIGSNVLRPGGNASVGLGDASNVWRSLYLDKTIIADASPGAQTINKPCGSVVFSIGAPSLVVTNNLAVAPTIVNIGSIITATVRTNDSTMKSVAVVCTADGSFTLFPNAAPTGVCRVDFAIITP